VAQAIGPLHPCSSHNRQPPVCDWMRLLPLLTSAAALTAGALLHR